MTIVRIVEDNLTFTLHQINEAPGMHQLNKQHFEGATYNNEEAGDDNLLNRCYRRVLTERSFLLTNLDSTSGYSGRDRERRGQRAVRVVAG